MAGEQKAVVFQYENGDFHMDLRSCSENSKFDEFLRSSWQKAMQNGHFKYKLDRVETKISDGYPKFIMQLNPERGLKRRPPSVFTHMQMPFDAGRFHFNKIQSDEVLCHLQCDGVDQNGTHKVIINVSPLEFGHVLLVPNAHACLPQRLDLTTALLGLHLLLLSSNKGFRVAFNSLLGLASVNHLHLHAWYLDQSLPLEYAKVEHICGRLHRTADHYATAFAFQLSGSTVQQLAHDLHSVTGFLQENNIAHNMFMMRGPRFGEDQSMPYSTVRVYIWPRKSKIDVKNTTSVAFNVAAAELAGHVPMYDEEAYKSLRGEDIFSVVKGSLFSEEEFLRITDSIRTVFSTSNGTL